jgi:hypothetical protein
MTPYVCQNVPTPKPLLSPRAEESIPTHHVTLDFGANSKRSWLEKLLENESVATLPQLQDQFLGDSLKCFFLFWAAEQKQSDKGGLLFLVLKAFRGDSMILDGAEEMPTWEESKCHLLAFLHLHSLSPHQRMRYANLIHSVYHTGCSSCQSNLFKETYLPSYSQMASVYFGNNPTSPSIWNNLPIPKAQAIGDIACINPIDTLRFAFSIGVEIDCICVDNNTKKNQKKSRIFQISQSPAISSLKDRACNGRNSLPILWTSDWRDAFTAHSVKNNRKSAVLNSMTISPTHDNVNSTKNTFPMAMGLKSSVHWPAVEYQFLKDTECLEDHTKPLLLYHGPSKKVVPVFISRLFSIEDKPERSSITRTLEGNSAYHKVFGTSAHIGPPFLRDVLDLKFYLCNSKEGKCDSLQGYGWSFQFVDHTHPKGNSGRLASCFECRRKRIVKLQGGQVYHGSPCSLCADWQFNDRTASILQTPLPGDDGRKFPKDWDFQNCPVEPPVGRVPQPNIHLAPLKITFPFLKQAARFAFYHLVAPHPNGRKGKFFWTKENAEVFTRTCCINKDVLEQLWELAKRVRDVKKNQDRIDYDDPFGIDDFKFPASWLAPLPLSSYVEALMHSLYHGMTASSFFMVLNLASKHNKKDLFWTMPTDSC